MKNKLSNIKMLQCVFGTNVCTLSCLYCGWPKKTERLTLTEEKRAQKNIDQISKFTKERLPNCNIFAITGGEPLLFPSIIDRILDRFKNMHIKISTNATTLNDDYFRRFKKHGNVSLCISLDGSDLKSNKCRYNNEVIFKKVLSNLDLTLKNNIPVEISCVINKENIDHFPKFCAWLENNYQEQIKKGFLTLIAYPITTYTKSPGQEIKFFYSSIQKMRLATFLEKQTTEFQILAKTKKYYLDFAQYLLGNLNKTKKECKKHNWCLTLEYVNNTLWTSGSFLSFGCGTKGSKNLGMFNFQNREDYDLLVERLKDKYLSAFFKGSFGECGNCFTNWHMIDLFYKKTFIKEKIVWNNIYSNKKKRATIK